MQTILGAGGPAGREIAKALTPYTDAIRLVSRTPRAVNPNDQLFPADLTRADETDAAVAGSEIAYLTVGLPYRTKVWERDWPLIMRNTIDACAKHDCKLVFFDNIYMYDPKHIPRHTEATPFNPSSKKGMVREHIARMLLQAVEQGKVQALFARSADFYGPDAHTSVLTEAVIKPLLAGKKANWFFSVDYRHSFTYTPDIGRATALLGNTEDAYNQAWHLPTAEPWTAKALIEKIAEAAGAPARYQLAGRTLVSIIGWFDPLMREVKEMLYQYDRDYYFDSSKFQQRFDLQPTGYAEGIATTVASFRQSS